MDPAQLARLMAEFDALCGQPDAAARVEALREEDPELAEALAQMLAADAAPDPALDATAPHPDALTQETEGPPREGPPSHLGDALPDRYRELKLLGRGGMGAVYRVLDRTLNRHAAMKVLAFAAPGLEARFRDEAQIMAQLQHPNIVPVHDMGTLADGRPYFTLREVEGDTWAETLARPRPDRDWVRRQVYVLWQVAQAVAYAHEQGVIHRDLKPSNVMLGTFGDVLLLDWGLVRVLPDSVVRSLQRESGALSPTAAGQVMGTPQFMAPEQAMGWIEAIGPEADVWSLGAMLYTILAGRPPHGPRVTPAQVTQTPPPPLVEPGPPQPLVDVCARAMAWDAGDRYPDASELAAALDAWLSGAADRERALALVEAVEQDRATLAELRAAAAKVHGDAHAELARVPLWAPAEDKAPAWRLQDQAAQADALVRRAMSEHERQLRTALELAPDLLRARQALAAHHRLAAEQATERRDAITAALHRDVVERYDPETHAAWLSGQTTLQVTSDPPAQAELLAWHPQQRRLRLLAPRVLGQTPVAGPVQAGSYTLRLTPTAGPAIDVPLRLRPETPRKVDLRLPPDLPPDTCYVAPGPFTVGGDPEAVDSWPAAEIDVPGFVVQRHPVTNWQFIHFLDALVAVGREAEAALHQPRTSAGAQAAPVYTRGPDGFAVGQDSEGVTWGQDEPVVGITWHAAVAWCAWHAAQTGRPWRLLHAVEWEKAARGEDGRVYPWGDHHDPAFSRMLTSVQGPPRRCPVDAHPDDVSPYGVRGLGGNVRDWCLNLWSRTPPDAVVLELPSGDGLRSTRGGSFYSQPTFCRAAARFAAPPGQRFGSVGFRAAYSWP